MVAMIRLATMYPRWMEIVGYVSLTVVVILVSGLDILIEVIPALRALSGH
jgi:hypothetical protein